MHAAMNGVADEARGGQRVDVALARLADATAQCSACHATHRIDATAGH
jgi:cytochrome c556